MESSEAERAIKGSKSVGNEAEKTCGFGSVFKIYGAAFTPLHVFLTRVNEPLYESFLFPESEDTRSLVAAKLRVIL